MNARAEIFPGLRDDLFEVAPVAANVPKKPPSRVWAPDQYAEQQIRGLVRRIFFPGWPKPARQVVFSAVDEGRDAGGICMQVARTLEIQTPGTVCVVEANRKGLELENTYGGTTGDPVSAVPKTGWLRKSSRQISDRLWFMPLEAFLGEDKTELSASWLRGRMGQLRLDFDYTVVHAAPAGRSTEVALLGQVSDGVILVLEANGTRRIAAQQSRAMLQTANVRLLGAVLSERTFPIPEALYRKL
jgi:hypothetical protein